MRLTMDSLTPDEQEKDLKDKIHELRLLRDAQSDDGNLRLAFQAEIEELTNEFLRVRLIGPRVAALDEAIERARRELASARSASEGTQDPWSPAAIGGGGLGGLLLVVWVWLSTGPFIPVAGVVLLAAGASAFFASLRWRRDGQLRAIDAEERLEDFLGQRRDLVEGHA